MSQSIRVRVHGATDIGLERTNNEDAFLVADASAHEPLTLPCTVDVCKRPLLLAVSDGMGGENAGEIASAMTIDALRSAFADNGGRQDDVTALITAIDAANAAVANASRQVGRHGMGATLVTGIIRDARAWFTTVGDSRAYVLRDGELVQVTKDQSMLQHLLDTRAITPDKAGDFEMRNVILQAIGRAERMQLELTRVDLCRGDRVLLCSDGLSSEVVVDSIKELLASEEGVEVICKRLIDAANKQGGHNISVVVAAVDGEEPHGRHEPIVVHVATRGAS